MLERELADRGFLLQRSRQVGPIFKLWHANSLWICVVGLAQARLLLQKQAHCLRAEGIDLTPLFAAGHLKQSAEHASYRKQLVRAISELELPLPWLEAIAAQELEHYLTLSPSAEAWTRTLTAVSTGMLITALLGIPPNCAEFELLRQGYDRLGPDGLVWRVGQAQKLPFQELVQRIRQLPRQPGSLLAAWPGEDDLEEGLLGNLVYLIEMGRWDLTALLQWASRFLADDSGLLERLAGQPELALGVLKECLRMAQGLRLMRRVQEDFVFLGFFWPRGANVRICLWEGHQQEDDFPSPFTFRPDRYLGDETPVNYAPFGLDQYRCPFGSTSLQLAGCFLQALSQNYQLAALPHSATPARLIHWHPDPPVAVALTRN